MEKILYQKKIDDISESDVLVIGGGPAGFAAAVAAARNGAKTMLIEREGTLGGMSTAGLVGPFMTSFAPDGKEQLIRGIFDELIRRTEARGGAIHPSKVPGFSTYSSYYDCNHTNTTPFLSETLAIVMDEMLAESGAYPLLYTQVADVATGSDGKIEYLLIHKKESLAAAKAKLYVDCTGDADVAFMSGVPTVMGNGEGFMQPATLFFEVGNIDREKYVAELEAHRDQLNNIYNGNCFNWLVRKARENGDWDLPLNGIGNYEQNIQGRWKINCSRIEGVDSTKSAELTRGHMEGRRQVHKIANCMRKYVPGCENMQILQVASRLGIRESRHIVGKYTLTVDDILKSRRFEDSICSFAYGVDVHQRGSAGSMAVLEDSYNIPYRSLVPEKCDNLLVAGRCISGTSEAAGSYRVMPACMATGEAAGTAAAIALENGVAPEYVNIKKLQKNLIEHGAYIKGYSSL